MFLSKVDWFQTLIKERILWGYQMFPVGNFAFQLGFWGFVVSIQIGCVGSMYLEILLMHYDNFNPDFGTMPSHHLDGFTTIKSLSAPHGFEPESLLVRSATDTSSWSFGFRVQNKFVVYLVKVEVFVMFGAKRFLIYQNVDYKISNFGENFPGWSRISFSILISAKSLDFQ